PLLLAAIEAIELVAEAIPLRVVQHGTHVDEHHQLALEEPRTRVIQSGGNATDGGAVELRPIQLSAEGNVALFYFGLEIDQIVRRATEDRLQARLLFVGEGEHLHDGRLPPPTARRQFSGHDTG